VLIPISNYSMSTSR